MPGDAYEAVTGIDADTTDLGSPHRRLFSVYMDIIEMAQRLNRRHDNPKVLAKLEQLEKALAKSVTAERALFVWMIEEAHQVRHIGRRLKGGWFMAPGAEARQYLLSQLIDAQPSQQDRGDDLIALRVALERVNVADESRAANKRGGGNRRGYISTAVELSRQFDLFGDAKRTPKQAYEAFKAALRTKKAIREVDLPD